MSFKISKLWQQWDDIMNFFSAITTGDDKGVTVKGGQFSVGEAGNGYESVFGEGDSIPFDTIFHYDQANESGLVITGATDVTAILESDQGSTTGLFDGTSTGLTILVGSLTRFGGAKAKIDTLGTVEADNIQAEYLFDNAPTWIPIPYMVTDSDFPYDSKADELGTCSSCSEQWRFGFDPDNLPVPWNLVTLNINGVNYERYWGRIRITAPITQDIILEQLKRHTNRYEINSDGSTEYFGRSRYQKDLVMHWELTVQQQGFSPANENIDFASNLSLVFQDNEFSAGAIDGRGGYIVMPEGIDTSIPLQIEALWIPEGSGTGDIKYRLITIPKRIGDLMDTSETGLTQDGMITISNQLHELQRTVLDVDISKLKPGEILGFAVQRIGNDAADTFPSTVSLINIRAIGYFYKP